MAERNGPLVFLLPWPPSRNALWRVVHTGKGSKIMLRSREYNEWFREAEQALAVQHVGPQHKVAGRVDIELDLNPPTRREYDPDNYSKAPIDFLVAKRLIVGDSNKFINRITINPHEKSISCGIWVVVTAEERSIRETSVTGHAEEESRRPISEAAA